MISIEREDEVCIRDGFGSVGVIVTGQEIMDMVSKSLIVFKNDKSRKSKTKGAKLSRRVGLVLAAAKRGWVWSTGAPVTEKQVLLPLIEAFDTLPDEEYKNLTPNAIVALGQLQDGFITDSAYHNKIHEIWRGVVS